MAHQRRRPPHPVVAGPPARGPGRSAGRRTAPGPGGPRAPAGDRHQRPDQGRCRARVRHHRHIDRGAHRLGRPGVARPDGLRGCRRGRRRLGHGRTGLGPARRDGSRRRHRRGRRGGGRAPGTAAAGHVPGGHHPGTVDRGVGLDLLQQGGGLDPPRVVPPTRSARPDRARHTAADLLLRARGPGPVGPGVGRHPQQPHRPGPDRPARQRGRRHRLRDLHHPGQADRLRRLRHRGRGGGGGARDQPGGVPRRHLRTGSVPRRVRRHRHRRSGLAGRGGHRGRVPAWRPVAAAGTVVVPGHRSGRAGRAAVHARRAGRARLPGP